jgi:hypothetical protein
VATRTIKIPNPMLSNLDLRVSLFTDADAFISHERRVWGRDEDSYGSAVCSARRNDPGNANGKYLVGIRIFLPGLNKGQAITVLTHEVFHAVDFICDYYGIDDMEFAAYLGGYTVQTVIDKVPTLRKA